MSDNQHRNKRPVEEKPLTGREKKRGKETRTYYAIQNTLLGLTERY